MTTEAKTPERDFNEQSAKGDRWGLEAYAALANWWADFLPSGKEQPLISDFKVLSQSPAAGDLLVFKAALGAKHATSWMERQDFVAGVYMALKPQVPRKPYTGGPEYKRIEMHYDCDAVLQYGLNVAGLNECGHVFPFRTVTYIHEDGRVFVPDAMGTRMISLPYEGGPETPHLDDKDISFEGCPVFVHESRYLVAPLEPGQKVTTCFTTFGTREYREETAGAGDSLWLLEELNKGVFEQLTQKDILDVRRFPQVVNLDISWKDEEKLFYTADGSPRHTPVDNEGHCRELSAPLRIKQVKEACAIGSGPNYAVARPGDYLMEKAAVPGENLRRVSVETLESLRTNYRLLPATPDGQPLGDKPVDPGTLLVRNPELKL